MPAFPPVVVRDPAPEDIVANPIRVCGLSTAFEGTVQLRVRDADDHVLAIGFTTGGADGVWGPFTGALALPHVPTTRHGTVEVYEASAEDGSELHLVRVPVVFGIALVHEYRGFRQHVVAPGETLSSIATAVYGDAAGWRVLFDANRDVIADPDVIFQGQSLRVPVGLGQ